MKKRIDQAKYTIKDFFENFIKVLRRPDMVLLPGNLSFFFVLAIIPMFGLISYGASFLNLSTDVLYDFIESSFSSEMADIVLGINLGSTQGISFFVTVILGFYIASNSADAIIVASNTIYHIENKPFFKRRIKACGMSFLMLILLIFMLIVPVFGNTIISLVKDVNISGVVTSRIISIFDLLKAQFLGLLYLS